MQTNVDLHTSSYTETCISNLAWWKTWWETFGANVPGEKTPMSSRGSWELTWELTQTGREENWVCLKYIPLYTSFATHSDCHRGSCHEMYFCLCSFKKNEMTIYKCIHSVYSLLFMRGRESMRLLIRLRERGTSKQNSDSRPGEGLLRSEGCYKGSGSLQITLKMEIIPKS